MANLEFKEAKFSQIAEIIVTMLDSFGDVAVMFLAGYFVMQGEMTIGEMVAFQIFANGVQGQSALIGKWDEIMEVRIAIERMNDVLEKNPEFPDADPDTKIVDEKIDLPTLLGGISLKNVLLDMNPTINQTFCKTSRSTSNREQGCFCGHFWVWKINADKVTLRFLYSVRG